MTFEKWKEIIAGEDHGDIFTSEGEDYNESYSIPVHLTVKEIREIAEALKEDGLKIKSYTLNHDGSWLAQVIITEDGMFSAVSEYGNFAFTCRTFSLHGHGESFEEFLLQMDKDSFYEKIYSSLTKVAGGTSKVRANCLLFCEKVLPALKIALKTTTKPIDNEEISKKAFQWISTGHVGQSSKTMWSCLMGVGHFGIHHPYDPDDFSRCHNLLEAVPEWRKELHKLKDLSPAWSALVDNWDKLTEMYLEGCKNGWRDSSMYDFMQTLIRQGVGRDD